MIERIREQQQQKAIAIAQEIVDGEAKIPSIILDWVFRFRQKSRPDLSLILSESRVSNQVTVIPRSIKMVPVFLSLITIGVFSYGFLFSPSSFRKGYTAPIAQERQRH